MVDSVSYTHLQRRSFRSPEKDLTRQEYERLVKAAKSHRNERLSLLLQTICSTGIRVSEHRFVTVEALQTGQVQISNKGKMRVIILPKMCIRDRPYSVPSLKPAHRSQHGKARPRSWSTALGQGLPPAERNKGPQW